MVQPRDRSSVDGGPVSNSLSDFEEIDLMAPLRGLPHHQPWSGAIANHRGKDFLWPERRRQGVSVTTINTYAKKKITKYHNL